MGSVFFPHLTKPLPPVSRKPYHITVIAVKPRITNRAFYVFSDNDFWFRSSISYDANNYRVLMRLRSVSPPLFIPFFLSVAYFIGYIFNNKKTIILKSPWIFINWAAKIVILTLIPLSL